MDGTQEQPQSPNGGNAPSGVPGIRRIEEQPARGAPRQPRRRRNIVGWLFAAAVVVAVAVVAVIQIVRAPGPDRITSFERRLADADVATIQTALCLPGDGVIGSETRAAIGWFEVANGLPDDGQIDHADGAKLAEFAAANGPCDIAEYRNALERLFLDEPSAVHRLETAFPIVDGQWQTFVIGDSRSDSGGLRTFLEADDGAVWLLLGSTIARFADDRLAVLSPSATTFPAGDIVQVLEASDGSIWVVTSSGLGHFVDGVWQAPVPSGDIAVKGSAIEAANGALWMRTDDGLARYDGSWSHWVAGAEDNLLVRPETVLSMVATRDGLVWLSVVPVVEDGPSLLSIDENGQWSSVSVPGSPSGCCLIAQASPEGDMRVFHNGFEAAYSDGTFAVVPRSAPLRAAPLAPAGSVEATTPDGILWTIVGVGNAQFPPGAYRREGTEWRRYMVGALPNPGPVTYALVAGRDESAWFGTGAGLFRHKDGTWTIFDESSRGIPTSTVRWLFQTTGGDLWLGPGGNQVVRIAQAISVAARPSEIRDRIAMVRAELGLAVDDAVTADVLAGLGIDPAALLAADVAGDESPRLVVAFEPGMTSALMNLLPGDALTIDLAASANRAGQPVASDVTYVIRAGTPSCRVGSTVGSWGFSLGGARLTGRVPVRLDALLSGCVLTVEATAVAEDGETAATTQDITFDAAGRNIVDVSAGAGFGCILSWSDEVTCWGGEGEAYGDIRAPADLRASAITTMTYAACAIRRDTAGVVCWGDYSEGGDRSQGEISPPDRVAAGPVAAISGGARDGCAVLADGQIDCWNAFTIQSNLMPVSATADILSLGETACFDLAQSILFCIKYDLAGFPGDPVNLGLAEAVVPFPDYGRVVSFTDPYSDVCAIFDDYRVRCFDFATKEIIDVSDRFPARPQQIVYNGVFACVLTEEGAIGCANIAEINPMQMVGPPEIPPEFRAVKIAAADYYGVCAVSIDDRVACWAVPQTDTLLNPVAMEIPEAIRAP